jgi:hypothetical protein
MLWSYFFVIIFLLTFINAVACLEGSQKLKRGALRGTEHFEEFPLEKLAAGLSLNCRQPDVVMTTMMKI